MEKARGEKWETMGVEREEGGEMESEGREGVCVCVCGVIGWIISSENK